MDDKSLSNGILNMEKLQQKNQKRGFFAKLGPGVISGAAGDDPSGIATYSMVGAQMGTSLLWTAWVSWPMMAIVQLACARIGMITGQGLSAALATKFPKPILVIICVALFAANTINIAADLLGMADATEMLLGVPTRLMVVLFAIGLSVSIIRFQYEQICRVLKWLVLVLFAYVITAFIVHPDWPVVARDTFIPSLPKGKESWSMLVAILGTTISPYLFFWQASQEVEEQKAMGRTTLIQRQGAKPHELHERMMDVGIGTFFSNLVMFFIILTAAFTLHNHGITHISTSRDAAEALKPLAGEGATLLFTLGIIGVGLLSIPTLCGSAAFAFAEVFNWRHGLSKKLKDARPFYGIILLSTLSAVILDCLDINPMKALYWSALVNGALAPFLIVGILLVARDSKVMKGQPSSRLQQLAMLVTMFIMFAALGAMIVL